MTLYFSRVTIKLGIHVLKQIQMEIFLFLMEGSTLKKLIVDEVEIGTDANKVLLTKDNSTGGFKAQTFNKGSSSKGGAKIDLSNNDTGHLSEGSNLYHTTARARGSISVSDSGGDGSLSYNSSTGVITYNGPSASETRNHFSGGTGVTINNGEISIGQNISTTSSVQFGKVTSTLIGNVTGDVTGSVSDISNHDTGDLSEGSNLYHTTARAR